MHTLNSSHYAKSQRVVLCYTMYCLPIILPVNPQVKCVRYWPEKLHDTLAMEQKFRVTFSSKMPFAEYEFRKFKLENVSPIDCVCFISLHKHF